MSDRDLKQNGNIIETRKLGNTTIHICDDCFAKTPEEIEGVLSDYHIAGWKIAQRIFSEGGTV